MDPDSGRVELPDPGPPPGYPQARLWRPYSLGQLNAEILLDSRTALHEGTEGSPVDLRVGFELGVLDELDLATQLELRAGAAPGDAALDDVAHAIEIAGRYAAYLSGTSRFALAFTLALWVPIQATGTTDFVSPYGGLPARLPADVILAPTLTAVGRFAPFFGLEASLSLPVALSDSPTEVLGLMVKPAFQPLPWLYLAAATGVAMQGTSDLLVPLEFELTVTPWGPLDFTARLAFPDVEGLGFSQRVLSAGLRFRT